MWTPLASIHDLDLRLPETACLGIAGEQLRIPVCRYCSYGGGNGPLYWHVDAKGGARRCAANGERSALGARYDAGRNRAYEPAWSATRYALGPERTNPFASLVPDGDFDPSRVGGLPEWVQGPEYPPCPGCGRFLRFIGQLDADEHGRWEGLIYAFLRDASRIAATLHQQT